MFSSECTKGYRGYKDGPLRGDKCKIYWEGDTYVVGAHLAQGWYMVRLNLLGKFLAMELGDSYAN